MTMQKTSGLSDTQRTAHAMMTAGDSGKALANVAETWFVTVAECQREMIGFVSMRLEKDGETTREIMGCKNPTEVAAIQSRWIEETLRDYNSEMSKLMDLCTKVVNGRGRP